MLLIALALFLQGIPALPNQSGTVTGILKYADGKPAVGVRITAVARPESPQDVALAAAISSLAETDQTGRYRLENIPPGHYHIAAGRIDLQTFYPGVLEISSATDILIKSGDIVTGIDFMLKDSSIGRAPDASSAGGVPTISVALTVTVEGGGRVPVFSPRGFARLVLTRTRDNVRSLASLDQRSINLTGSDASFSTGSEYQASVEGLPDGFAVRTFTYGAADLMTSTLRIPASNFAATSQAQLFSQLLSAGLAGATTSVSSPSPPPPVSSIQLVLAFVSAPAPPASGVRVTGRSTTSGTRSIYISGSPGMLYADGTFEFLGVPAGRHMVITRDGSRTSRPLAAVVVVGNRDVDGVPLEEILVLPPDFETPSAPVADPRAPGTVVRLANLRGRLIDEATRLGIPEGIVYFSGMERISFRLKADGSFEIPHLLPGSYKLEIQVFGYKNISDTILVAGDDIDFELSTSLVVKPVD